MLRTTTSIVAFLAFSYPIFCNAETPFEASLLKNSVEKIGLSASAAYTRDIQFSFPESTLPQSQQSYALNRVVREFGRIKSEYASKKQENTFAEERWLAAAAIGWAVVESAPSPATVKVAVAGTVAAMAASHYLQQANAALDAKATQKTVELIAVNRDPILNDLGLTSFDDIRTQFQQNSDTRKILSDRLRSADTVFQDVRNRARESGRPDLADPMQDMMLDVLANLTPDIIDKINSVSQDVQNNTLKIDHVYDEHIKLSENLVDYREQVQKTYDDLKENVDLLVSEVTIVQNGLAELSNEVSRIGEGQALLADFMFADMPPDRKVAFLKSGAMDSSIRCPTSEPNCDTNALKSRLVEQYTAEAKTISTLKDVQQFAKGLGDVGKIAANLGIDSPELSMAISTGQNLSNAVLSFASSPPNILGGVAAISSLFGKGKDPAQERHIALMNFLTAQFAEVNKTLDEILENQQKILKGLENLSEQINDSFVHLDRRLNVLESELLTTSYNVKRLLWEPWQGCYLVYYEALHDDELVNPSTLQFYSLDAIFELYSKRSFVENCRNKALEEFQTSATASGTWGSFGDLQAMITPDVPSNSTYSTEMLDEARAYKTALDNFLEQTHQPARKFLEIIAPEYGGMAGAFALLVRPNETIGSWEFAKASLRKKPFECVTARTEYPQIYPLLCTSDGRLTEESIARRHFDVAFSADAIIDVAEWMIVVSQVVDFHQDFPESKWVTSLEELLQTPARREANGEELLLKTIRLLDVAIASFSATYGPAAAEGILKVLLSTTNEFEEEKKDAIELLQRNPVLASNVLVLLLNHTSRNARTGGEKAHNSPSFFDYSVALRQAQLSQDFEPWMLERMFPADGEFFFARLGENETVARVVAGAASVDIVLPSPFAFAQGKFTSPPSLTRLLAVRATLVEQWASYQLFDSLNEDERLAILSSL